MTQKRVKKMLTKLEEIVMDSLWSAGEGTVNDVLKIVQKKKQLAYTTIMTVMVRLMNKGILCRRELDNGSFMYKPCFTRDEFYAKTSHAVFKEMLSKFGSSVIKQFINALEETDPGQLKKLKYILNNKKPPHGFATLALSILTISLIWLPLNRESLTLDLEPICAEKTMLCQNISGLMSAINFSPINFSPRR